MASIMNDYGGRGIPFIFILDFDLKKPFIAPIDEVDPSVICYSLNGKGNDSPPHQPEKELAFEAHPVSRDRYQTAFETARTHINYGNSFLLNLTMPSRVEMNYSLKEVFQCSRAKYKLWFRDEFVVFSPETFVRIDGLTISSYPMKGTIDAALPDAENRLRHSKKELAEHYTIVDLIRNDLSMVAKNVKVKRFQYIDRIKTNRKELLQMSSEITGELPEGYRNNLGDILLKMLPAGSISGAPKRKTVEIIRQAEQYERGYYTGIFGVFDGTNLDSGVMIRYIERSGNSFIYKSGGGITALSDPEEEYQELIDKIYIPL